MSGAGVYWRFSLNKPLVLPGVNKKCFGKRPYDIERDGLPTHRTLFVILCDTLTLFVILCDTLTLFVMPCLAY